MNYYGNFFQEKIILYHFNTYISHEVPRVTQNFTYLSAVFAQNFVVVNRNTQSIPGSSVLF